MSKKTGYGNSSVMPIVGTAGHLLGAVGKRNKGETQESDLEKIKRILNSVCPVNKNVPTKMLKSSFISSCLKFREIANKDKGRKNKASVTTPSGFKSSNKGTCIECKRGDKIAKGLPFEPPVNMTFAELIDIPGRKEVVVKLKKKRKRKWVAKPKKVKKPKPPPKVRGLSVPDVIKIRKLYDAGEKLMNICKLFPKVGREAVSRAANRKTFKDI